MNRLVRPAITYACSCALVALSPAQGGGTGFEPLLVASAAANSDGTTDAAEWKAYLGRVAASEPVDAKVVKLAILARLLDADTDGALTRADLDAAFTAMDADASGTLSANETRLGGGGARASARTGGFADRLARGVLAQAADSDASGEVSGEEWSALLATAGEGAVEPAVLGKWMQAAEAAPGGRTAFTPGIFMMTVGGNLDVDRNGRISRSDLQSAFSSLDGDGDGNVDAAELATRPSRDTGNSGADNGAGPIGPRRAPRAAPIDRNLPPLMPWQRSLEDALATVKRTG